MTGDATTGDRALRESVGRLSLFADLDAEEISALLPLVQEVTYDEGEWVVRQGELNAPLRIIVDGEAGVVIADREVARLGSGSFFGEISALLAEDTSADVVARRPLRCLVIEAADLEEFLFAHPRVMFRMLQVEARRVRSKDDLRL